MAKQGSGSTKSTPLKNTKLANWISIIDFLWNVVNMKLWIHWIWKNRDEENFCTVEISYNKGL